MANLDPEVWAAVESAIRRNPSATLDELLALAAGVSPGIEKLDRRQFNARYPLQIKRKLGIKGGGGGGTDRAKPATASRRKAGRPKKVGGAKKAIGKRPGRPRKSAVTTAAAGAKRRGRPPKSAVSGAAQTGAKRRGRPPKNSVSAPAPTGAKRRGRPPKNAVAGAAPTGAKRRGRPPKNPVAAPAQTGAKRRGRPPKNPVAVPAQLGAKRRGRPPGSGKKAVGRPRASTTGGNRDSIRNTLMGFAQDILSAAAEAPKKLVQVIAGIDHYVDRISKS